LENKILNKRKHDFFQKVNLALEISKHDFFFCFNAHLHLLVLVKRIMKKKSVFTVSQKSSLILAMQ